MVDIEPEKQVVDFKRQVMLAGRKMLNTGHNATSKLFDAVYLTVTPHIEDEGAEMTLFYGIQGTVHRFSELGKLKFPDAKDPSGKRHISFEITDEKMENVYNTLGHGVAELRTAYGEEKLTPHHLYFTALYSENTVKASSEFFDTEDEPTSHAEAVDTWLEDLRKGDAAYFRKMLEEQDEKMGLTL